MLVVEEWNMLFNKTDRVLVIYNGTNQDGLLAAATVKKAWKESHDIDDKLFMESDNKIASKTGAITFRIWMNDDKFDSVGIDRFDRIIIIGVPTSYEMMRTLHKTYKKKLIWIECSDENIFMVDSSKTETGYLLNKIDGLRSDAYSLCELTWMFYNEVGIDSIPLIYNYIGQFYASGHDALIDKDRVVDFVFGCMRNIKDYDAWYTILMKIDDESSSMEMVEKLTKD